MEKWKIIVIVALLAGLGGYGFYQQNASQAPPPQPDPKAQKNEPPANQKLLAMKGKVPPAWDIPANLWVNAKVPITLASLKGSPALLEFWRTGCPHCQEAAPFMNQLHKQYGAQGLKIVTFQSPGAPGADNPENDWQAVRQIIKEWGISYPVAFDKEGRLFKKTYGGDRYPATMLLDREGKVQFVETGMERPDQKQQLIANIEKMLEKK